VITVHNSYIIPAKNLSSVISASANSTLQQINHDMLPKTVIVVNAQKIVSTNSMKGNEAGIINHAK
jgi:hypothetical protein